MKKPLVVYKWLLLIRNLYTFILKRPIIIQDRKILQIGYKEEEIRAFIPRKLRTFTLTEQATVGDH
ncbi:ArsC/Spx/MgsR family protein [Priestia aryabhattai]|uniref:ArsC/Spx/MgsR family protein n=1 Tax=Priestia aryabhattai TaxID=412384 RepID=UPI003D2A4341